MDAMSGWEGAQRQPVVMLINYFLLGSLMVRIVSSFPIDLMSFKKTMEL